MSIQAVKAVEIGDGCHLAEIDSSQGRDPIVTGGKRLSNVAGGIEGGVSNGMPIRLRVFLKPLPGVGAAIETIDMKNGQPAKAEVERHDTVVIRAAAVVGRAMVCLVLADAILERTGGDTLDQVKENLSYLQRQ